MRNPFDETRKALEQQDTDLLPCRWCQKPTKRETLSNYGARCWKCYEAYCIAPIPARDKIAISVADNHPHAWAHRLHARRQMGQRLSPAQQHCLGEFEKRHGASLPSQT